MNEVDKQHNEPAFTPAALPAAIAAAMKSSTKAGKADLKAGNKLFAAVQEYNAPIIKRGGKVDDQMIITAERLSSKFESKNLDLIKTMKAWRLALLALAIEGATTETIANIYIATNGRPATRLNSSQKKMYSETRHIWNTKFENLKKRLETAENDVALDLINKKLEAKKELTEGEALLINPPKESVTGELVKIYAKLHRLLDPSDEKNDKYHHDGLDVTEAGQALNAFGTVLTAAVKRQEIKD